MYVSLYLSIVLRYFVTYDNYSILLNIVHLTLLLRGGGAHCTVSQSFTVTWTEPFIQIYTKFAKIFNHILKIYALN